MKTYTILVHSYGGEFVIGTLPRDVISYWQDQDEENLHRHLVWDDVPDFTFPKKYSIYPFHEQDNILHECGARLSSYNGIQVFEDGINECDKLVFETELRVENDLIQEQGYLVNDTFNEYSYQYKKKEGLLVAKSIEKGDWVYKFETPNSFDLNKLSFFLHRVTDDYVLSYMEYDGKDVEFFDGTTRGKGFVTDLF